MTTDIKNIALGISGGIAAYKTPDLVRRLVGAEFEVIPVLTQSATRFVTQTSLATVSGNRVRDDLWDEEAEQNMGHIELARWADLLLIAPATAQMIATMANGLSPNLLATIYLATSAPTAIAPAMNQQMWQHPATERNLKKLQEDGVFCWGPAEGDQACGETGPGRMLEPESILEELLKLRDQLSGKGLLSNVRVLVSAGPTREAIDPVRYISNASSGRQGFALAKAAREEGATVTLISGPVELETPVGVERIDVVSTDEMKNAVFSHAGSHDLFISVAAVADYRPATVAEMKIKKDRSHDSKLANLKLDLVENDDILICLAERFPNMLKVGFAAETDDVLNHARSKRIRKSLDYIVVNDVSKPSIGFHGEDNECTLIHADGEKRLRKASKDEIARQILREIAPSLRSRLQR